MALSSKLRRKSIYPFSNPFFYCFRSQKPTATLSWLGTHWILNSILSLLTVAHIILHLSWALVFVVTAGVMLLACTSVTQHPTYKSSSFMGSMELTTPAKKHIRVLEVEVSSPMTAGQSYYFKMGGIPIRTAWVRRELIGTTKKLKYTAVLFLFVDTEASSELEVYGPYIIPPTPPIATDRTLDIVTLDSGVVEGYQILAWRFELTRREKDTSLTWFNDSPDMLIAWFKHAGFGKHLCKRIICYGKSYQYLTEEISMKKARSDVAVNGKLPKRKYKQRHFDTIAEAMYSGIIQLSEDSIEYVLQDFFPCSRNIYGKLNSP